MEKVIDLQGISNVSKQIKQQGKKIVLVGGCFDILHPGHFEFLRKAAEQADALFVLLESDANVRKLKGEGRPVHSAQKRADALAAFPDVDYVVLLPNFTRDSEYASLVKTIEPDIIAVTRPDPLKKIKENQAKSVGGRVVEVMERRAEHSTSKIIKTKHV